MTKPRSGLNKSCMVCAKEFYVPNYRKNTAKFCSQACQNHGQYERRKYNCAGCFKEFESSPSRAKKKFCSVECRSLLAASIKERRRQSKYTTMVSRGRGYSKRLRSWIWIFKKKECEICYYNKRDYCLDVHHIDLDPTNNLLTNLAILCSFCHKELHKGDLSDAITKRYIRRNGQKKHRERDVWWGESATSGSDCFIQKGRVKPGQAS